MPPFATRLEVLLSARDRKCLEKSESVAREGCIESTTSLAMYAMRATVVVNECLRSGGRYVGTSVASTQYRSHSFSHIQ